MHHDDIVLWLAALRLPGLGASRFRQLLEIFGDIKKIFSASFDELNDKNIPVDVIASLQEVNLQQAEKDLAWTDKNFVSLTTLQDADYPELLKETSAAPLVLFSQGDKDLLKKPQLAMVGTRNPSATGKEIAVQFAKCLTQNHLVVTSGLALGIDTESHKGALQTGETIAVLGSGLTHIYPASNKKLAQEISEKGLLLSEFPPGTPPNARNFPMRNRIISGLSLGVIVVEATVRSGSLITARFALEQNREVFAIPGSIYNPLSRGCHYLIRQGAKLVETAQDILEELQIELIKESKKSSVENKKLDQNQRLIINKLGHETTAIDTIIARSGLTATEVSSILLSLEMAGQVGIVPGGYRRLI